jgi:inner membrane protein
MRNRLFLKLVVLGGISILLLTALSSVDGLARERRQRFHGVQRNIADSYAGEQRITGPVFVVEYRERWTGRLYNKERETWYEKEMEALRTATVFPAQLRYTGSLSVQERYRGIYKANVFQSTGRIEGTVDFPELTEFRKEPDASIELVSLRAAFLIRDPRGISSVPYLEWNGRELPVSAGSSLQPDGDGIHAELPDAAALFGSGSTFAMDLMLHGMGQLEFVPIGSENRVRIESPWPHPSFTGDFLAADRTVSAEGFDAEWRINGLACSARQQLLAGETKDLQRLGVSLIDPVNPYALTDRALKYGFLFVFITFAAFFLFELTRELHIHPVQYGFVGLAQALFFLLLLSLSEHLGFGASYLAAGLATVALLVVYLCSVLKGLRRGLFFGGLLSVLYGTLYALLQSEDHALLAGSALLFGLTALVMLLTRRLDWYALSARQGNTR